MGFEDLLYTCFSRPPLLQLYLLPILLLLRLTLTLTEFSLSSFSIVACESLQQLEHIGVRSRLGPCDGKRRCRFALCIARCGAGAVS